MDTYYPLFKLSQQENKTLNLQNPKNGRIIRWLCFLSEVWHAHCSIKTKNIPPPLYPRSILSILRSSLLRRTGALACRSEAEIPFAGLRRTGARHQPRRTGASKKRSVESASGTGFWRRGITHCYYILRYMNNERIVNNE